MRRVIYVIAAVALVARAALAVDLFSESFDADHTASWTKNDNLIGTNAANFFFDYSTVGIPSAPHSTGGSTRGLKLSANIGVAPASGIPGISVSPVGLSLTGDYTLEFDWWHNYLGPLNTNSQVGSTELGTFGVMTTGTVANTPGTADGVYFAATGDGGTAADFRIYSPETPGGTGYASPDPLAHTTYAAASQNSSAALYGTVFPAGATAPGSQPGMFASQSGATLAGNAGFRWHDVKIVKSGTQVQWFVNGMLLGTLQTANLSAPALGGNILFGQSDINTTTSVDANFPSIEFSLIDNVTVTSLPPADFNNNSLIDAADYTIWRDNFGNNNSTKATGDANGDHITDLSDFTIWKNAIISPGSGGLSTTGVPEPSTLLLAITAAALFVTRSHALRGNASPRRSRGARQRSFFGRAPFSG